MTPYRKPPIPGRNKPCPCKSGKKAKYCCLHKIETIAALPPHLREQYLAAQILTPVAPPIVVTPTGPVTVEEAIAVLSEEATARIDTQASEVLYP